MTATATYTKNLTVPLSAWINDYKSQRDDGVAIPSAELVISVSLSEQSAGQVRKLLRVWLDPSSELGETEALTQGTTR
jgi:hypothetical protein